jgi:hypothetical protein
LAAVLQPVATSNAIRQTIGNLRRRTAIEFIGPDIIERLIPGEKKLDRAEFARFRRGLLHGCE